MASPDLVIIKYQDSVGCLEIFKMNPFFPTYPKQVFHDICLLQLIHAFCYLVVSYSNEIHDDVIKWKHFPRYWPFVRGIHRSPVNSPHKGQWRGTLMFSLICVWINDWVNNRKTGDLRRYRGHYDVTVIYWQRFINEHPKLGINKIGWYHSVVNLRLTHGYVIISPNLWCEVIILQYLNLWGG